MNKRSRIWEVLALLAMLLAVGVGLNAARAGGQASDAGSNYLPVPANPADKVEVLLQERLTAEGSGDFIIRFAEQADLAPASEMSWEEQGEFVYNTLREVAQRSQAKAKAELDELGLSYETFIAGNDLYVWSGDLDAVAVMAALPEVASIRATRTFYVDPIVESDEAQPQADMAWGIQNTKANQFWSTFGKQGDGIVVAGIDTGVQWDHPALIDAYKCGSNPTSAICWRDPANICGPSGACDNDGHGTHTMGTMVANDDPSLAYIAGMAPNAQWIACKGCEANSCSDYALSTCADWILAPNGDPANRPNVVNNSWGGEGCNPWYSAKVWAWRNAGIFPAFSAGNMGSGCNTLGSPGDYQASFATAAHDVYGAIASFSSRGDPSFCYGHEPYTKPNISAPGVEVCSTYPGSAWSCKYSGTSMASPHTAGAVALLWSCNPSLVGQIDQTFQILQNTADSTPAGNCGAPPDGEGNYTYGYGYLNILAAGQQYCTPPSTATPTNTPTDTPQPTATFTPRPTLTPLPPYTPNTWTYLPLLLRNIWVGPTRTPTATPTNTPQETATHTPSPTTSGGWQTIIAENFEGTFPGPWSVYDDYAGYGEYYWGKRNCRVYAGSFSGWGVGGGADGSALACGSDYPYNTSGWMVYGPFSLSDASVAEITFMLWLNSEKDYDGVCRLYSTNGSTWDGWCTSGNTGGWIDRQLDLPAGQSQVWVALEFSSDEIINYAEGGYVDDILVRKCVGGSCPTSDAAPLPEGVREWPVQMQMSLPQSGE